MLFNKNTFHEIKTKKKSKWRKAKRICWSKIYSNWNVKSSSLGKKEMTAQGNLKFQEWRKNKRNGNDVGKCTMIVFPFWLL